MTKGYCPECDVTIGLGRSPRKGQLVSCFKCGAYLKVASLSPIKLDWVYEDEPETSIDHYVDHEYKGN
jgi:lysine biosynthesis protein LysW